MMRRHVGMRLGLVCLSLVSALGLSSLAAADEGDPPSRIARLAYIEGDVSFQPGGTDDWVIAPLNRPLTTGDRLWADRYSRVELQLDGSLLRLSSSTSMSFLNLDDNVTQIQLSGGTLILNVRRLRSNETYEVDTPNLAFSVLRPGVYRLTVDESGTVTTVIVRSGQGEVTGGGTAYSVYANEADVFSGTDTLTASTQNLGPAGDSFDEWSSHRDGRWESSVSAQYVSSDVVGYEDLDGHGDWNQTPDYGAVWFPREVESSWAPYHDGHWSYIAPWGYTWVDDEPWGFAPFHYGRWVSYRGAWGWVPAPPPRQGFGYVRPVYAPALVAWVGVGSGIAWFALGPREVYCPSYPVSRHYVYEINESNTTVNNVVVNNIYSTTIINNRTVNVPNVTYANRSVPGAVAATTSRAFMSAQPVSRNLMKIDHREITNARVRVFAPAVVPTRQAVLGSSQLARARPPAEDQTRAVVSRASPPPPPPPFERRVEAIRNNAGRPLSAAAVRNIQPAAAARAVPIRIAPAAMPVPAAAHPATLGQAPVRSQPPEERPRVQQPEGRQQVAQRLQQQQTPPQQDVQRQPAPQQLQQQARAQQEAQRPQAAQRQQQQQLEMRAQQEAQRQQVAQQEQLQARAQQEAQRQQAAQRQQQQQLEMRAQQEAQRQFAAQQQQMRAQQEAQHQQVAQQQLQQQLQQQQLQQMRMQQESQRQAAQQQQARAQQEAQRQQVPQPQQQGQLRPGNRPEPGQPR